MHRIAIALMFVAAGCTPKQPITMASVPPPPPEEMVRAASQTTAPPQAAAGALAATITERTIRAHMEFLASDALNGRGSGTRDEWIAATYIASQFRAWGLEPMGDAGGYVQTIEMGFTEAVAPALTAGALTFVHGRDMLATPGTSLQVSGPLHKVEPGKPAPAGSVALVPAGATLEPAMTASAAVVLTAETPQVRARWDATAARPLRLTQPRAVKLAASPAAAAPAPRPARIVLSAGAASAIAALPAGTPVSFTAESKPGQTYTWNTVGKLTGTDPALSSEVIVLSAHLDHIGARPPQPGTDTINNGADDDASGTVAVMALAEALSKAPRPRRTIVFALFGSEESGGYGAGFFVDLPVVPLDRLVADLQFEMLGRPDPKIPPNHLWLTGYERSNLGAELAKQGAALVADPHPDQSFFTRSDNIRFARRGVVAHTVSSYNLHKEYHTVADEIGMIDFPYMTASIKSLVEPIRWLANGAFKPTWNPGGCPAPCK